MKVTIENVVEGASGVWTARIEPQSLLRLGNPIRQGGRLSIVMVSGPSFESKGQSLQFDLDSALLLNLGNTAEAILVNSREAEVIKTEVSVEQIGLRFSAGDQRFIKGIGVLPDMLQKLGRQLLAEVRKQFPGELVYHPKSDKFVESPDNFWVIRIQPRAASYRIIVYGTPQKHGKRGAIELKDDMAGYSNFVIGTEGQLHDAIDVICTAKRLKDNR